MLGRLRDRLALIRYHSAERTHSRWTRVLDVALVVCVGAGIGTLLVIENFATDETEIVRQQVLLRGEMDLQLEARFLLKDEDLRQGAYPAGEVTIRLLQREHGWPVPTRLETNLLQFDVNDFLRVGTDIDVDLDPDSPLGRALQDGFDRWDGRALSPIEPALAEAWKQPASGAQRYWIGTILGAGMWWIALFLLTVIAVRLTQVTTFFMVRRRFGRAHARLSSGECAKCGYNLTGLEFNEHCPECGALTGIWED